MRYDDDWIAPWRHAEQARCKGEGCTSNGAHPGTLVIAATLDEQGLCAACGRLADDSNRELRLEV